MAGAPKELKLFRVEIGESTYVATAEDAFAAFARVVAHDAKEGNYSHQDMFDARVISEEVGVSAVEVLAWEFA